MKLREITVSYAVCLTKSFLISFLELHCFQPSKGESILTFMFIHHCFLRAAIVSKEISNNEFHETTIRVEIKAALIFFLATSQNHYQIYTKELL